MRRVKRYVSAIVTAAFCFCIIMPLSGCNASQDENYPVNVANFTFNKEPKNIVALSDGVADILMAIGYEARLVGRSEECTQSSLQVVPAVGSKSSPDVSKIISLETEVVFADQELMSEYKIQLTDAGIKVITIYPCNTTEELEILFTSLGALLGGNKKGRSQAALAFNRQNKQLSDMCLLVSEDDPTNTACYLYLDSEGLKTFIKGTYGDELIRYTGATNIAANFDSDIIVARVLKIANPRYLFYADQEVLNYIKNSEDLSDLFAINNETAYKMPKEYFVRQGKTAVDAVAFMASKIYGLSYYNETSSMETPTEIDEDFTINNNVPETTEATLPSDSVADEYGIIITDHLELKPEDENDNVMALQKRLADLGFLTAEPTGFFGDLTVGAIEKFEEANGMNKTGKATNEVIKAIFYKDAKSSD